MRNVLAAGGCTIRWNGADHAATDPRLIGIADAADAFHPIQRWILRTAGVRSFTGCAALGLGLHELLGHGVGGLGEDRDAFEIDVVDRVTRDVVARVHRRPAVARARLRCGA